MPVGTCAYSKRKFLSFRVCANLTTAFVRLFVCSTTCMIGPMAIKDHVAFELISYQ